jgi:hypothetical protein
LYCSPLQLLRSCTEINTNPNQYKKINNKKRNKAALPGSGVSFGEPVLEGLDALHGIAVEVVQT